MARQRTRKIKVHTVDMEVDETETHYLVFFSPHIEAQALGIGYHRARLPKCLCPMVTGAAPGTGFSGTGVRCRWCRGWSADGMAKHVGRLLRSYPKKTITVAVDTGREVSAQDRIRSVVAAAA